MSETKRSPVRYTSESKRISGGDSITVIWEGLTMLDCDGQPFELPPWSSKCVQLIGESGSVAIEGSLDGQHWSILHNQWTEEDLYLSFYGMADVAENPRYIRPRVTAGDELTKFGVTLFVRRTS